MSWETHITITVDGKIENVKDFLMDKLPRFSIAGFWLDVVENNKKKYIGDNENLDKTINAINKLDCIDKCIIHQDTRQTCFDTDINDLEDMSGLYGLYVDMKIVIGPEVFYHIVIYNGNEIYSCREVHCDYCDKPYYKHWDYKKKEMVLDCKDTMILYFSGSQCPQCKMFDEQLSKIDHIALLLTKYVDDPDTAEKYNVTSYPTLVFIKSGTFVGNVTGFHTAEQIKDYVSEVFGNIH